MLTEPAQVRDNLFTQRQVMSNVEILIAGMIVTFIACVGVLYRTLGYDEGKNTKKFEVDTDLGAIHKYER